MSCGPRTRNRGNPHRAPHSETPGTTSRLLWCLEPWRMPGGECETSPDPPQRNCFRPAKHETSENNDDHDDDDGSGDGRGPEGEGDGRKVCSMSDALIPRSISPATNTR